MSYLVYCIVRNRRELARRSITGIGGRPVFVAAANGLGAAISEMGAVATTPQLNDLMAFGKAVEAFNRCQTVVPMRYGCRFDALAQVRGWLRGREAEFEALLHRLDGCVEMGVRVLLAQSANRERVGAAPAIDPRSAGPGAAYLAARRTELVIHDQAERVAHSLRSAMAGWFRDCVVETAPSRRGPMLSLYFLVHFSALNRFRAAFGRIGSINGAALLLSGPWPPYNFVCGDRTQDARNGMNPPDGGAREQRGRDG